MIAVTFALPNESSSFLQCLEQKCGQGRGVGSWIEGNLGNHSILVWHIGVGTASARLQGNRLLEHARPELVICAGYAGALASGKAKGDLVLDWQGLTPPRAFRDLPRCSVGTIHTTEHAVESPADKVALGRESGAVAVDMEMQALVSLFHPENLPVLGLRGISDRVEDELPVPMPYWFDMARQKPNVAGLLYYLARHPAKVLPFARFVRELSPVRETLARGLVELILQVPAAG